MNIRHTAIALALLSSMVQPAIAAVSAEEAAKLGNELTPLGAERAGNEEGTIPAWTGGFQGTLAASDGRRSDPFEDEKPLYTVTAENMDQYADILTDGVKAMLEKYPDTYRLDVYPTHRTASAPAWVYENTANNAVRGDLDGSIPRNVYGGIPFPMPKTGEEAIWNHKLSWRGSSWEVALNQYQITGDGKLIPTTHATLRQRMPYYFKDGSAETFEGYFWELNVETLGPPIRAGEMVVARQHFDEEKTKTYTYLSGQRRVRRVPNACCDQPTPTTAGLMFYDELSVFSGKTSNFDWKLVGKKEMLIPYNENKFLQAKESDIVTGQHLNPEHVRWELHRVWVVESNLSEGNRHQAPKSVYYLDEDTWQASLGDRWDSEGQLWKTLWMFNYVMPEVGGAVQQTFGYNDLLSNTAYIANVMNDQDYHQKQTDRWPTVMFTADGLAAQGVR